MRILLISLLCLLMSACWWQDEVISVDRNGNVQWLVIAEPYWEYSSVNEVRRDLNSYTEQMTKAGWIVKTRPQNEPVKQGKDVVVALTGNLKQVKATTDFYRITSRNNSEVKIEFVCPKIGDDRVNRAIRVKSESNSAQLMTRIKSDDQRIGCGQGVVTFSLK